MIDTLIFDFAGVVTKENFTPALLRACREELGLNEQDVKAGFLEYVHQLLIGKKSVRDLWDRVCKNTDVSYQAFIEVFGNAYEVNEDMVQLIRKLKKKYSIVMLSDNFQILSENIKHNPKFNGLFEQIFFSNEIGLTKTMPGCFEYVLQELHKDPQACLFTDDKEENLLPARAIGITGIRFENSKQFVQELNSIGVNVV